MDEPVSPAKAFTDFLFKRLGPSPRIRDSGLVARFKRCDNPDLSYQVWDTLFAFRIDVEKDSCRLPYCTVAAALCRANPPADGSAGLGEALRSCFEQDSADQGSMRLRRILGCDNVVELCAVLRPVLSLIGSRGTKCLSYSVLLDELLKFDGPWRDAIRMRWARQFWRIPKETEGE